MLWHDLENFLQTSGIGGCVDTSAVLCVCVVFLICWVFRNRPPLYIFVHRNRSVRGNTTRAVGDGGRVGHSSRVSLYFSWLVFVEIISEDVRKKIRTQGIAERERYLSA